jgi:hypothetical protein
MTPPDTSSERYSILQFALTRYQSSAEYQADLGNSARMHMTWDYVCLQRHYMSAKKVARKRTQRYKLFNISVIPRFGSYFIEKLSKSSLPKIMWLALQSEVEFARRVPTCAT